MEKIYVVTINNYNSDYCIIGQGTNVFSNEEYAKKYMNHACNAMTKHTTSVIRFNENVFRGKIYSQNDSEKVIEYKSGNSNALSNCNPVGYIDGSIVPCYINHACVTKVPSYEFCPHQDHDDCCGVCKGDISVCKHYADSIEAQFNTVNIR